MPRSVLRRCLFPRGSWRERVAWTGKLRALAACRALRRALRGGAQRQAAAVWHDRVGLPALREGRVSVVLPVFNQRDLLGEAMHSVLAQTWQDLELIVVDDGSTDGVGEILRPHLRDPRVRLLTQPNQKLPAALSHGFRFASGTLWTWTSADNLMEPTMIERLAGFLDAHDDVAMVYADYVAIDDRGEPLRDPSFRPMNRRRPDCAAIRLPRSTVDLNAVKDNFIGPCFLYRALAGRLLGDYEPRLGMEDYDYWMRMNHGFRIAHLGDDALLYRYRVHDNSLSGRAEELGIFEQGRRLMGFERQRAAAFRRELPRFIHPQPVTGDDGALRLLVATAAALPSIAAAPPAPGVGLVVTIDDGGRAAFAQRVLLRRYAHCCVTTDADAARFAALLHERVLLAKTLDEGLELAARSWRDAGFRERHRARPTNAELPRPWFGDAGLRVLLQVDRLDGGDPEHSLRTLADQLSAAPAARVLLAVLDDEAPPQFGGSAVLHLPARDRSARYRRLLRDERIDVIAAVHSTFGLGIAHEIGVPFVRMLQDCTVRFDAAERERWLAADAEVSAYLCASDRVAWHAARALGLDADKMIVVPNAAQPIPAATPEAAAALGRSAAPVRLPATGSLLELPVKVLGWLAQRGAPAAARAWTREATAAGDGTRRGHEHR